MRDSLQMCLLGACLAGAALPAAAQESAPGDEVEVETDVDAELGTRAEDEARQRFLVGSDAFEAGDYERAAAEFDAAYELSPRPELLYNIYLAHERLGNLERAEVALSDFIEAGAPGRRVDPLRRRLERLRGRLAEQQAAAEAAAERERRLRAEAAAARDAGPWPWITAGAGGGVAAVGLALLLVARADIDAVENPSDPEPRWDDVAGRHDRAPKMSTAGAVALGVGGAALLAGLTWGLLTLGRDEVDMEVSLGVGALSLRGAF